MQDRIFNDAKSVLYTTGSDTDYELIDESLIGASNRMLFSRYGKQPIVTNSPIIGNITISATPPFSADYTITVTNSGNSYILSGTDRNGAVSGSQPTLAFNAGDKVRFSVNSSTATAHPFYIKTTQSTGTANQVSGTVGAGTTTVDWTTAIDGAGSYGYQCSIHLGMWNTITVS
jgi:FtsP/CotA-like multicopper oxidase with cupredoxin domain